MKDKATYQDGNSLPLHRFFAALQQSGIGTTPAQIAAAHELLQHYAPLVPGEAALCDCLCPLFATNAAEQERFREIYTAHFMPQPAAVIPPGNGGQTSTRRRWIRYLAILLPAALAVYYFYTLSRPPLAEVNIAFSVSGPYYSSDADNNDNHYTVGDSLQGQVEAAYSDGRSMQHTVLKTVYDWDDGAAPDSSGRHIYRRSGIYTARATVQVSDKSGLLKEDTLESTLYICGRKNDATISSSADNDSVPLIRPVTVWLELNSMPPPGIVEWEVLNEGGRQVSFMRGGYSSLSRYTWAADSEGVYTVNCRMVYDSLAADPCTYTATRLIYAHDPNKPEAAASIRPAGNAGSLKPAYTIRRGWFWLLGGLSLLAIVVAGIMHRQYKRLRYAGDNRPMPDEAYREWLDALQSDKPAAEIPFLQKNQLAPPEPGMAAIARLMRRRIEGEARYLHIRKTIAKAVRSSGLFRPVYEPRTQQSEYLLLIEESHINSQRTRLFDYIADLMRRHNVLVEKYYYRYEPTLCYNEHTPRGISLDKLSEQYSGHVLLLAGHGHQMLYPYQPMVSPVYQSLLARWKHRALLTPVPYADWGPPEKNILPAVLPVFPADTEGVYLMMETLAGTRTDAAEGLREAAAGWYSTESVDFGDAAELAAYCAGAPGGSTTDPYQNLLFQWIAALAVYPGLHWQLTLAIGKTLLDAAGMGHQLCYTSLLRLVRIPWMNEGIMPQELRLELLKKLTPAHEIMARETILALLNEIPANELRPGHAAYEEKETQRIINEFNLYACDPVKYKNYAASKQLFERLWQDKKIMDAPLKQYLRNELLQWPNLINSRMSDTGGNTTNVPLEEYFKPLPPSANAAAKRYETMRNVLSMVNGLCILLMLVLLVLQFIGWKGWPWLTRLKQQEQYVTFTATDSTSRKRAGEVVVRVDDSSLVAGAGSRVRLPVNGDKRVISVAAGGKVLFDTFMTIGHNRYDVVIKDKMSVITKQKGFVLKLITQMGCLNEESKMIQRLLHDLDSNIWQTIKWVSTDGINSSQKCIAEIRVGKGVDEKVVNVLIQLFKKAGVYLTLQPGGVALNVNQYNTPSISEVSIRQTPSNLDTVFTFHVNDSVYYPKNGEVIISGQSAKSNLNLPVPPKPIIFLQVSDASMTASAQQFRKELLLKGYNVKEVEVQRWNYNSEIYYFDKVVAASASDIERLYRRYYPALPLKASLRKTNDRREGDNRIVVWMKQLQKEVPDGQPEKEDNNDRYSTVMGKRIVSIAQKEIGTGEVPPGSSKTKYGRWYNPQMNEAGLSWSAVFVAWVYSQAGMQLRLDQGGNGFASYARLLQYAKDQQLMVTEPQPGDIFILDMAKTSYHGGIFVKWLDRDAGTFETVEGNISTGNNQNGYVGKGVRNAKKQKIYFVRIRQKVNLSGAY